MYPPIGPRHRRAPEPPSWRVISVGFAVVAAIPLVLWAVSQPVTGAAVAVVLAGLLTGMRHPATPTTDRETFVAEEQSTGGTD